MPYYIIEAISTVLRTRNETMYAAYKQKGGWEGWTQVEVAIALGALKGGKVERERNIYVHNPDQRADVVLTYPSRPGAAAGSELVEILELKAWGMQRKLSDFKTLVQTDIQKILSTADAVNTCAWAIVLVCDPSVKEEIKKVMLAMVRPNQDHVREDVQKVESGPDAGATIYVLSFIMPVNVGKPLTILSHL